jgi:hypothetical protein
MTSPIERERGLLDWLDRLMGIPPGRVTAAVARIQSFGIPALTSRFARLRSLDDAVRALLLAEDVEGLVARGVQENKLVSKLKDTAQFEATWAEIRCAALIARRSDADVGIELESGRASGRQPDVRLVLPEGPPHTSVEIKAIGLANDEVAFMRRMGPVLGLLMPPVGLVNVHSPLDGAAPRFTTAALKPQHDEAARWASSVPGYPDGLAAATIVARATEVSYTRRVARRVEEAIGQLPPGDECWVGIHWTNGAPIDAVVGALNWDEIPSRVVGLLFVGCVFAFPHRNIDCYLVGATRGSAGVDPQYESDYDVTIARLIFERTEVSGGVRAAAMRAPIRGRQREILRRDGRERILPFNLVLDRDPVGPPFAGRATRNALDPSGPWVEYRPSTEQGRR